MISPAAPREQPLVLSLFPGIGLLDMAFELEGFCVVRGPDLLWGGDVKRFHPPAGKFEGVIGGPPCQRFSSLSNINRARYGEDSLAPNLIPEFERVVYEARPLWFVMENVLNAPLPNVAGYWNDSRLVRDVWCGGLTNRLRRFTLGTRPSRPCFDIEVVALHGEAARPSVALRAVDDAARVGIGAAACRARDYSIERPPIW
jgi:DNA (cytosine-5)-methyltransferase 1